MINLHERMLPTLRGSNPQPPDHQSDAHPTEPPWPAQGKQVSWKVTQAGMVSFEGLTQVEIIYHLGV